MAVPSTEVVGIDGCRAGWVCIHVAGGNYRAEVHADIQSAWQRFSHVALILIDVPIGLRDAGEEPRECEMRARRLLGRRHVCVFTPPLRSSLRGASFEAASRHNFELCGRRVTKQAWAIAPKIAEMDAFLCQHPEAARVVRETHPEICFWSLNGRRAIQHRKKQAAGRKARHEILAGYVPTIDELVAGVRAIFRRREVATDDIYDALVAAVTAREVVAGRGATLPEDPAVDSQGLRMEIVYPRPGPSICRDGVSGSGRPEPGAADRSDDED